MRNRRFVLSSQDMSVSTWTPRLMTGQHHTWSSIWRTRNERTRQYSHQHKDISAVEWGIACFLLLHTAWYKRQIHCRHTPSTVSPPAPEETRRTMNKRDERKPQLAPHIRSAAFESVSGNLNKKTNNNNNNYNKVQKQTVHSFANIIKTQKESYKALWIALWYGISSHSPLPQSKPSVTGFIYIQ